MYKCAIKSKILSLLKKIVEANAKTFENFSAILNETKKKYEKFKTSFSRHLFCPIHCHTLIHVSL